MDSFRAGMKKTMSFGGVRPRSIAGNSLECSDDGKDINSPRRGGAFLKFGRTRSVNNNLFEEDQQNESIFFLN